jgi:hypothetical protein
MCLRVALTSVAALAAGGSAETRSFDVTASASSISDAAVGSTLRLPNNKWGADYTTGSCNCSVDRFVARLNWPSGTGPAYIIQTTDDGYHYAFHPQGVIPHLSEQVRRDLAESRIKSLRAQLAGEFGAPRPTLELPEVFIIPSGNGELNLTQRRLQQALWLSQRGGQAWYGSEDELQAAWERERKRVNEAGRAARDFSGRRRPVNDSAPAGVSGTMHI